MKSETIWDSKEHITDRGIERSPSKLVKAGTLLFSFKLSIGRMAFAGVDLYTNEAIAALPVRNESVLDKRYLYYCLAALDVTSHANVAAKGMVLNKAKLEALRIPLPSLSEQRRIVELLAQADQLRRLRSGTATKSGRILPALFGEMFGDPETNFRGLPVVPLEHLIADGPQNGLYKPSSEYGRGTPILRIDGFYAGQVVNPTQWKRLNVSAAELATYGLRENDIIINRVNSEEYLGKSAIVPTLDEPAVFESNMMRFSVDQSRVLPVFVIAHLQTAFTRREILRKAKRAINQASINQQDVLSLTVVQPSMNEQKRFAARAVVAQEVVSRSAAVKMKLDALFVRMVAGAFRGELTAAWRSAHVKELLEEMQQQARHLAAA